LLMLHLCLAAAKILEAIAGTPTDPARLLYQAT